MARKRSNIDTDKGDKNYTRKLSITRMLKLGKTIRAEMKI
jgi:hypothetical protein